MFYINNKTPSKKNIFVFLDEKILYSKTLINIINIIYKNIIIKVMNLYMIIFNILKIFKF